MTKQELHHNWNKIMKIKEIKEEMLNWHDFYGQDIGPTDEIKKAKTKRQLYEIMRGHIYFLETQNIDAITHAENFIKKLGLV